MPTKRTIALFWLVLMLYAAVQAVLVVRAGNSPFFYVFIGNIISEHVRLGMLLGCWWLISRYVYYRRWWLQAVSYVTLAMFLGSLQFAFDIGFTMLMRAEHAAGEMLKNGQWIILQSVLENGIAVAGIVLMQYRRELRQREERERELRLLNTQMELSALRSQVNPHFLFNALNTVNALVGANPEQARRVLETLSELLRYSLQSDKQDFVLLKDELDFVQKYLSIEQERFGQRLQAITEVDKTLLEALVPPMLIQPLVENAVKHGISPKAVGGTVTVRIFAEGAKKRMCVEVSDDGMGMKIGNLNNHEHSKHEHSNGIGLNNTDARLRKLFGEESALNVHGAEDGVTVRFSIPIDVQTHHSPDKPHHSP